MTNAYANLVRMFGAQSHAVWIGCLLGGCSKPSPTAIDAAPQVLAPEPIAFTGDASLEDPSTQHRDKDPSSMAACRRYDELRQRSEGQTIVQCDFLKKQLASAAQQCGDKTPADAAEDVSVIVSDCFEAIIGRENEQRAATLRKLNPARFRAELKTQAAFDKSVSEFCARDCQASLVRDDSCEVALVRYRAMQVIAVNQHALALDDAAPRTKRAHGFDDFAHGICQLPNDAWREKKVSKTCEASVISQIETVMGITDDCD